MFDAEGRVLRPSTVCGCPAGTGRVTRWSWQIEWVGWLLMVGGMVVANLWRDPRVVPVAYWTGVAGFFWLAVKQKRPVIWRTRCCVACGLDAPLHWERRR